ncbi:MAG: S-adenosylmethionine:tRNA ribosyltransferase-isomerase [Bacteroidales bacterium]|nr:S-adenosylmethionine:tRNA ribosyltransferase-isomerase [Bacteroidales bacterium]
MIPVIDIKDYDYNLPDSRIAKYPLPERDSSKLLCYRGGKVEERIFRELPSLVPSGTFMVFNDTRVVPARLFFRRQSGARIEIFCLEPSDPPEYAENFASCGTCVWKCVIGNSKRWKGDTLLYDGSSPEMDAIALKADLLSLEGLSGQVRFSWSGDKTFSEVLECCGRVPIPPYLNRETEEIDLRRYQTLYARVRGSVAAPTAGLHFTESVLAELEAKGVECGRVCLHVGAGTFLPVKDRMVSRHSMHREPISVSAAFLRSLKAAKAAGRPVLAVGTTSVRTLESLYYAGVYCIEQGAPSEVGQWDPYEREYPYTLEQTLDALISWLEKEGRESLSLGTRIIIVPGFCFRVTDLLVTNFHQPQSTLLLLVSAFLDGDWKTVYDFALGHDFRFLSYGDSSLLIRSGAEI